MSKAAVPITTLIFLFFACALSPRAGIPSLSGEKALEFVRSQVAFGPRPPGSVTLQRCRAYLVEQLRGFGYQVEDDAFDAQTPYGSKKMVNLIARKGTGEKGVLALASHYDTKYMEGKQFVGANDAGSSTGLLLELARVLAPRDDGLDYWFVFLDGEEAFVEWSAFDGTYGSRHLAARWARDGTLKRVKALINVDMIGDRDLGILQEWNSAPGLRKLVWQAAADLGFQRHFLNRPASIEDDHIPFLRQGVQALDLIDFDYPPWHTAGDTMDKLSLNSFNVVGQVVLETLLRLERLP